MRSTQWLRELFGLVCCSQKTVGNAKKIGYLSNQYPALSHTFIRREIVALENAGVEIQRLSVRRARHELIDSADIEEQKNTFTLLDHPYWIFGSIFLAFISTPSGFFRALHSAYRSSRCASAGAKYYAYFLESCLLLRIGKKRNIAHVHVHMGTNPAAVAQLCRIMSGPTYSITMHGPEEWGNPDGFELAYKTSGAEFVVCISDFAAKQLSQICSTDDSQKINVVRCGVDGGFIDLPRSEMAEDIKFVFVGRLCDAKNPLLLIDSFREVVKSHPLVQLAICGDGALREEVERRISKYGLNESVELIGWANQEEVVSHIQDSVALVLPSMSEGLPVVIMEAMALRRPVISTFVAGIPELIEDGVNGWLIDSGDRVGLISAMQKCLDTDRSDLVKMGESGRAAVLEKHDIQKNIALLKLEFEKVICD